MKIHVGDTVVVIAGKDKGKQGEVLQVLAKQDKVIVEGVNMATKHIKPSQADPEGGIVTREAPIHVSNVAFYDSTSAPVFLLTRTLIFLPSFSTNLYPSLTEKLEQKLIKRKRNRRIKNEPFNGTLSKRSG